MANHQVMLIIVADLDNIGRTKKDKVILFPNHIILIQKHKTYFKFNEFN